MPTLFLSIITLSVGYPRLSVLGGLPGTDEGFYAFQSQLISKSLEVKNALPSDGPLMIYPTIVSWVFSHNWNHLIVLRLIDFILAIAASYLLLCLLLKESHDKVFTLSITALFMFTLNEPVFIQNGFRNSIFAAYIPLIIALKLILYPYNWSINFFIAGVLTALAILTREPLILFGLIFLTYISYKFKKKQITQYLFGGLATTIIITGTIVAIRGDYVGLLDSYKNSSAIFKAVEDQKLSLFRENGITFLREAPVIIGSFLAALFFFVTSIRRDNSLKGQSKKLLWLSITICPLIEPILKISSPYHFSFTILGLTGFVVSCWEESKLSQKKISGFITAFLCSIVILSKSTALNHSFKHTIENLKALSNPHWPTQTINQSNYLIAAEIINKIKKPGDTLSVSGFMYTLYPLTNLLPPSFKLSNLSETVIQTGLNDYALKNTIKSCPPSILVTTTRKEWPGSEIISSVIEEMADYKKIVNLPQDDKKSYGNFGGTIYISRKNTACNI